MKILGRPVPGKTPQTAVLDAMDISATCRACGTSVAGHPRYATHRVCDVCGAYAPISAQKRIETLLDRGSFRESDADLRSADPLVFEDEQPYRVRLRTLRNETGESDAIVIGRGAIRGHPVAIAVLDFGFLGGSMGVVVGEKLVRAVEISLKERRPLITVVASGGARMQEGMLSLLQMAKTASAIQRLHAAGIPHVSILTHPTTGGVFASFASLGDVIVAEPKSLIGFAGPRVAEQFLGRPLPPGSHTAEFLLEHGMIDGIVDRTRLRGFIASMLGIFGQRPAESRGATAKTEHRITTSGDAWESVLAARDPDRPTALAYVEHMFDQFIELHGDRESGDDPAIVAGLGSIDNRAVAVIAIERGAGDDRERRRGGRPMPEGYRKAQRVMRLAARFGLPVVTLVDTPGAYPGVESEERGLAGEIAESMALMSDLPVPIVAAVTGEGGSGGALALAVADRVLIQEHAIYSVIAPEGAAAILYRDASRAPEVAERLKITAADILRLGIADQIVAEPEGGAKADPAHAADLLKEAIAAALDELERVKRDRLVHARYDRYRAIGAEFVTNRPDRSTPGRLNVIARREADRSGQESVNG